MLIGEPLMKKLIALLMAAVLCLSLGACGSETQAGSNGAQQEAGNSTNKQAVAIVVHIVINPEFNIHVGNDGNVFDVECLNEDAKAVSDKVSVTGKSCEDAIILILQETVDQGFLKDRGEIEITVSVAEEISNQMDTWNETVMNSVTQVLAGNDLNAHISFGSQIMEPQKEENSNPSDPIPPENKDEDISDDNGSSETDANGNTIIQSEKGFITIDKNGNKVLEVYTADDGTVITLNYGENGTIVHATYASKDGTAVTQDYDEDGNMIQEIRTENDGTVITWNYDENGKVAFQRNEYADGSWSEYTYKDGVPVKEISEFIDGSSTIRQETEFYENGNRKLAYTYNQGDSSYSEVMYYENGIKSYEYNFINESQYTERSYYADGNKKTDKSMDADGTIWDLTYNPDGSHYGYTYYPDGSVWYNEWDANDVQDLAAQKQIK